MTKFPSHYECLNVTRDAPPEVIRAAYRSLSQKHHPDKNVGDEAAVQMMARLNTAYSVLSDLDQRELYDLQILYEQRPAVRKKADEMLRGIHRHVQGRHARIAAAVLCLLILSVMAALWYVWRDNQTMLRVEQAAFYTADAAPSTQEPEQSSAHAASSAAKGKAAGAGTAETAAPSGIGAVAAELSKPAAPQKAPSATAKATEYERLTAMLKSMGLGLHKLDLPSLASNTKQPPPPPPAKPAEAAKPAPAPAAPVQAARSAAAPEASRAREEAERPADPVPARSEAKPVVAEASRASAPPVASVSASSASSALRPAVLVDARACPTPAYPITAYRNGESGSVLLALLVANDGRVLESKIQKSSGSSDLDKAARKALSQCRFKPASSDSQADPTWATLTYVWSID
ncbi:TonB family protein [Rugamonas aquatica]|uniref:TonB family protein n=1 Tax=Rugamonas aquatica TaxID=2743357 RepID=A0A6A7MXS5_9BURK|nr:TonB family protein [Rugamonas aquatica]MQA37553.1 TonB family protein [Rugamonas aquatica]